MRARSIIIGSVLLAASCGGLDSDPIKPDATPVENWENRAPKLTVASPGYLAVGDTLTILGQDFVAPDKGNVEVVFKGNYFDDQGNSDAVDLQAKGSRPGSEAGKWGGKVTWKLWPNIVFHRNGDRLGYFLGDIAVLNIGNDGSQRYSERLPVKIEVRPSLIPRLARPTSSNCQAIVGDTLEDTGFAFVVEAIGLRTATTDNPITFYWTFLADQWQVSSTYGTDPNSLFPKTGAFMLEDKITTGTSSMVQDGGSRMFLLKVGSDMLGSTGLKVLKTGKVPTAGNTYDSTVNIAAVDSSGKSVKLSIPINIARMADLVYDGAMKIAERFPPTMVSDCIPGGDIGRQVTYSEDNSESRSRNLGFNYNASVGVNIAPFPANPFALGINFSLGFGVEVGSSISSSQSKGLNINGTILPKQYGVFYRQTTKAVRIAHIIGRNSCGQTVDLGEAILTDWLFTPELATGPTCIPPSKLPKAEKFM
jgi:hypothetical protein